MRTSLRWLSAVALGCALLIAGAAGAQSVPPGSEYRIGPVPEWVLPVTHGKVDKKLRAQATDGVFYLLSDQQLRSSPTRVRFDRYATLALTAKGVESIANIEIAFDPSYQTLTLHAIDVIRAGVVIGKLASAKVQVLQRETELEARIYDGSKSASIFLDDVRVGDIVDYAYSVQGRNPVFGDSEFGRQSLQYSVPVGRVHFRLLLPATDTIKVLPRNLETSVVGSDRAGYREYLWNLTDRPALTVDSGAPDWFDPYPSIQWSAYSDWAAVVRWAQPLYALPARLSPDLQGEIQRIKETEATEAGRLAAVLRWVQGEVRYLGVEIGASSHAPSAPSTVYERRFGDCKDKALLTIAMLDRLGMKAHPALVNTSLQRGVRERQPSPGNFDHVIVQASIDGKTFWLDPTRPQQKGDLNHLIQPDFDYALVIAAGTTALTPMKNASTALGKRKVHALLDAREGFNKPLTYTVVTTAEGGRAEALRNSLNTSSHEEVRKQFVNFYASYYPGISSAGPLEVVEDDVENRITTTERYRIADAPEWNESTKRHTFDIYVPDILELLTEPEATVRSAPLALTHPTDTTVVTELLLPDDWTVTPSVDAVDDPAFFFERKIEAEPRRMLITDSFRSKLDEISAADTPRYVASLQSSRGHTGYEVYWGTPLSGVAGAPAEAEEAQSAGPQGLDKFNWLVAALGLAACCLHAGLALLAWRFDPEPRVPAAKGPQGIAGWLLIPTLTVILSPFLVLYTINETLPAYATDTWVALTTFGDDAYHALWAPVLLFELVANLGLLVFSLLLVPLFFLRRSSLPAMFTAFLGIRASVLIIDAVAARNLPVEPEVLSESMTDAVRAVFHTLIWGAYFHLSKRVKATFVRRRGPSVEATPAAIEALVDDVAVEGAEPAAVIEEARS